MELDREAIAGADQLSAAFRNVAKSLRPSVVSIQSLVDQKPVQRNLRGRRGLPPGIPRSLLRFSGAALSAASISPMTCKKKNLRQIQAEVLVVKPVLDQVLS